MRFRRDCSLASDSLLHILSIKQDDMVHTGSVAVDSCLLLLMLPL